MVELGLRVARDRVEPVSDRLMDALDALSVSVEDADAGTDAEEALFGEPGMPAPEPGWHASTLRALFDDDTAAERAAAALLADGDDGVVLQSLQPVADADWVRLTQSQFAPVAVAPGFWIVPSWHAAPADAVRVIRLDPGLAFGTGTHPTTRMCLRWIAAHAPVGRRTLDYGCGSGVLAIAAALHGAVDVDAVDIDPVAVAAARANATVNGTALRVGPPEIAHGRYGVVLANILAMPLTLLAPLLSNLVTDGGALVLAGILDRQADAIRAAYAPWLALAVADREDGWSLLTATRTARGAAADP